MKKILKRYRAFFITAAAIVILTLVNQETGLKALSVSAYSFLEMLLVIPPIFKIGRAHV